MRATEYLEIIQKEYYGDEAEARQAVWNSDMVHSLILDSFMEAYPDMESNELQRITQHFESIKAIAPTKYEHPTFFNIAKNQLDSIDHAMSKLGLKPIVMPILGTIPSRQISASALLVPESNEYLLLFDTEIFHLANLFCKATSLFIHIYEENGVVKFDLSEKAFEKTVNKDSPAFKHILELAMCLAIHGTASAASPYWPQPPHIFLSTLFTDSFEKFIISHEYAHVYLDHFSDCPTQKILFGKLEGETMSTSWKQEIEADLLASLLTITAMSEDGHDMGFSYCGIFLSFWAFEIFERAITLYQGGNRTRTHAKTHPPLTTRKGKLINFVIESYSGELREDILIKLERIDSLLERVWLVMERELSSGLH